MAEAIRVFVGSSSEATGGGPADVLCTLLQEHVGAGARVEHWMAKFRVMESYIESLERASATADFAVLVATPDDPTTIRGVDKLAPRDNVIFELGLFMGALGRNRCFLVQQDNPDLHLPTDLLGVKPAKFKRPLDDDLKAALYQPAMQIVGRINDLGVREKLTSEAVATRTRRRAFAELVEGTWWERILGQQDRQDAGALSFFRIVPDSVDGFVTLNGRTYALNGEPAANWHSEIVRLDMDGHRLLHAWTGRAVRPDVANRSFNGFGEMKFDPPGYGSRLLSSGYGNFWRVDEAHPEETVSKPIQLRRVTDPTFIETMTSGSGHDKQELVRQIIEKW